MNKIPPFWLVWNPSGHIPRFQHDSYASAQIEAERLARQNPGQVFYVLCPVAKGVKQEIVWETLISEDEAQTLFGDCIPF